MARKKRTKKHVGEIYAINPVHIVKNHSQYVSVKDGKSKNRRLVMVGVEKSVNKVQISNMTTKANPSHVSSNQRVRMINTFPNKNSYVDTNTISKSKLTKKHFRIGEPPLTRAQTVAHPDDIKTYQESRKKRGRYKKRPPR